MNSNRSRVRRLFAWTWRHPIRAAGFVLLLGFLLLNVLAYQHARAMLNFAGEKGRTARPQELSASQKFKVLICGVTIPRPTNGGSPSTLDLPFETLQFASDDGTNLEAWLIVPPAPRGTVLFFHGYTATRSTLLEEARECHALGFATVLVDFRGGGGSEGSGTTLGHQEGRDVAAALAQVRARGLPGPVVLYGQSMGAAAVLRGIAVHDVRPDGIVLESVFDRMLSTVRNRFGLMGVPSFPAADLLVFWGGVQLGFSGFGHNPRDYARACDCDALLLHGSDDREALLEEGENVRANLGGSKEMVVFAGADHSSLYRANPEQWRDAMKRFLVQLAEKRQR